MTPTASTKPTSSTYSISAVSKSEMIRVPSVPQGLRRLPSTASSTRSTESSASSQSAASSAQDTPPSEALVKVGEIYYRHGRVEDSPLMTEIQFSNYRFHYSDCAPRVFLDNLDYPGMTAWHAERMM
ncbi:hypothetical protein DFQ27_006165, partial [Actinomortierella ambigua]